MPRTVDLVVQGHDARARTAAVSALLRGHRVLIVLPPAEAHAAPTLRRTLARSAPLTRAALTIITIAEIVCAAGADNIEAVVIRYPRTGRLFAVNTSELLCR